MRHLRSVLALGFVLLQLWSLAAQAISEEMQRLVTFETKANAVASRSNQKIILEHFEIPLELVEANVALRAPPQFVQSMIFEKNGKKLVRWILNPEDTKWHKEVEKFLRQNGVPALRYKYFEGYQTASRSYIAVDPQSGAEFSIKGSTDKTGGHWADKKQTWDDAKQIRKITDFVADSLKQQPALQNIVLLDETMAFGIKGLDQALVIRSYDGLTNSGKTYVPGFSVMHDEVGRKIAKLNGSDDPGTFWNEHYNKPLGRALAEFLALTGMVYDSPHSQNFLVELDANLRPTGKIALRDFGDAYLLENYFEAIGRKDITQVWEKDNVIKDKLRVSVGILHGNEEPSWLNVADVSGTNKSYRKWGSDFHSEFLNEFERQTGIRMQTSQVTASVDSPKYIGRTYFFNTVSGIEFLNLAKKGLTRDNLMIRSCTRVFAM